MISMAWLEKDNPQHVHLRTLRSRFLLPLILAAVAVIAIAVSTAWSLADAARRDAESSMAALARVAGVATVAPLPSDAVWYRIDQVGKVVTSSDADAVGKPLADRVLLMEVVAMKEGAVTLQGAEGLRRVYGFARLSGAPGGARYVVVGRPADKVFAALDESLRTWAVLGTILAVIALWLAAVIGDVLLVRKARRLAATMREVVSGDMEARKSLESGLGELDDLTGIFDAITAKIGEAYSATEQKVKKRTVELEFNKGMAELEKARTEALLTSVGDGLFATDNEGRITFINQQGEKMLGFTSKDLVGNMAPVFLRLETDKGEIVPQEKRPTSIALATGARYESQAVLFHSQGQDALPGADHCHPYRGGWNRGRHHSGVPRHHR
jgi:PAS domain-containing protein